MEFKPKIIALICRWCASAAADLAGVSRLEYPSNVVPIRVPCSGRIDMQHIISAFENGADGVLIGGCHIPADCHYISGNFKALKRVAMMKKLLSETGVDPRRLRLEWISAAEGARFADVIREFTEEIKKLGPLERTGGEK